MRILSRYIFREFLVPLGYCLVGFVAIYVLFELFGSFSRIMDAGIRFPVAARYFAGYLSPFFHYLAPAALMLATLYTMWNLSRHSEVTAMRASGISLSAIARPIVFASMLVAGLVAWVNESYMPRNAQWAVRLRAAKFDREEAFSAAGFSYSNSQGHRIWTVKGSRNDRCSAFSDVAVAVNRPSGEREMTITADNARYLDGEWWFFNPKVQHYSTDGRPVASPTPEVDALPLRAFPLFDEKPDDMAVQNGDIRYGSVKDKLRHLDKNRDLNAETRRDIKYDAWAQALSPLVCVLITLIAIPAGMASGRQSVFLGVVGALFLFFAYEAFIVGMMIMAKTALVPPIPAAILPHVAFFVLGVFHCARSMKATIWLLVAFVALTAAYVASASYLQSRIGMEYAMAHSLAGTLPALVALVCALRFRSN